MLLGLEKSRYRQKQQLFTLPEGHCRVAKATKGLEDFSFQETAVWTIMHIIGNYKDFFVFFYLATPSVPSRNFKPTLVSFSVSETKIFAIRL